jgi:hypothetical protein
MSMGSVDLVEEIVPYLGADQIDVVPSSWGGASHAPLLAVRVRRRRFTVKNHSIEL